jgi:hypothetical protein
MRLSSLLLTALLLPFIQTTAHAFELGDHKAIMNQATQEFEACFPKTLTSWDRILIAQSDLFEDENIFRKDTLYSHFYNPYKKLNMRRYTSDVRVANLSKDLAEPLGNDSWDSWGRLIALGEMIHHLQDMATPPHVVPVMHGPFDGFERYDFKGDISSGISCAELMAMPAMEDEPNSLLQSTSITTLQNVAELHFVARSTSGTLSISGSDFWKDSGNDNFGHYGSLGNHYGAPTLTVNGVVYTPSSADYDTFKQAQMKLAVQSSLKALFWYYRTAR